MKRLKVLGAGVIMTLALTALLGASSASASQFRSEIYPVAVSGEQVASQKITTSGGITKCSTATLAGSVTAASSALSVTPTYSGCKAFGQEGVTIKLNSCHYTFHSTNESAPYTGTMDVACENPWEVIEINVAPTGCKVAIPVQSALASIAFANTGVGTGRSITATWNVSGLKYTESVSGCLGKERGKQREDGTYVGSTSLKAAAGHGLYLANEQQEEGAPFFRAESYPATVKAVANEVKLSTNKGSMACGTINGAGTLTGPLSKFEMGATWVNGCTLAGHLYTVAMNGCSFVTQVSGGSPFPGLLGVTCGEVGKAITMTYEGCVISLPPQQGVALTITNNGTGSTRGVQAKSSAENLTYTIGPINCGITPGTFSNGILLSTWQLSGFTAEGLQQGVWVE